MAGIQKTCKDCGTELNKDDKHGRCDECRAARRAKWKSRFKTGAKVVGAIGAVLGLAYLASRSSSDDSNSFPYVDFDDGTDDTVETDTSASKVPEHASGEKYWNSRTQNWEKDGKPYTYRVTYKDARDREVHTHEYSDVDNGYEDYEHYRKRWYTSQVEWDHVPPSEE